MIADFGNIAAKRINLIGYIDFGSKKTEDDEGNKIAQD